MADKQNIPKGKMHSNCMLLPEDIVCKITQRNNIKRANTCDPVLKLLNEEITSDIQKHKQNIWKEHLDAHWDHRHNTHTLWKTIHGLMLRVRLFVHVHLLILVYYVFPQLVKRVLIHSLIDLLCMLLQHCGIPLI